jgi:hypothetical protein
MADDRKCAWCSEPATTTAVFQLGLGFKRRVPACERCKAAGERKNLYMPCIIGERLESMSDEEHAAILKATKWADRITNAEWGALLEEDGFSRSARSRLKSKAAEWLMALARIAYLRPELFAEIAAKADETYREQIEDDSLLLQTVRMLAEKTADPPDDATAIVSTVGFERDEDAG